jgi:hypothetical protein
LFVEIFLSNVGIFSPSGEPISLHLLRCDPFVVGKRDVPMIIRKGMRLPRRFAPRNDVYSNLVS